MSTQLLEIAFDPEAGEMYETTVNQMVSWGCTIVPERGEPFDAILMGADHDAGWYGTVKCIRVVDEEYDVNAYADDAVISVVAKRIEIS